MEIKIPIVIDNEALQEAVDKRVAELKQEGDFVIVTRCKDCKNYTVWEHPSARWEGKALHCIKFRRKVNPNDFCSNAEPKETEGEG